MEPEWAKWIREHPGQSLPANLLAELLREREHDIKWRDDLIVELKGKLSATSPSSQGFPIHLYDEYVEKSLPEEALWIFQAAKDEDISFGCESLFSRRVVDFVERNGNAALGAIRTLLDKKEVDRNLLAESMIWIGDMKHEETKGSRRGLLLRALEDEDVVIRADAVTGITLFNDPSFVPALHLAATKQKEYPELKEQMTRAIKHLSPKPPVGKPKGVKATEEPPGSPSMISGEDVCLSIFVLPDTTLSMVCAVTKGTWLEAIVEDADTGQEIDAFAPEAFSRDVFAKIHGVMIYKDRKSLESWDKEGRTSSNGNTMIYAIVDRDAFRLTMVADDWEEDDTRKILDQVEEILGENGAQ